MLSDEEALAGVELVLMGEGAAKDELVRLVQAAPAARRHRVVLRPHGPVSEARALMRTADLGFVSLVPGIISYAYPSKTASYLSEGLPLLLAVEADSQLARCVTEWGVGQVISTASRESVTQDLLGLLENREAISQMQSRTQVVWKENFSAESKLVEWDGLVEQLIEERGEDESGRDHRGGSPIGHQHASRRPRQPAWLRDLAL